MAIRRRAAWRRGAATGVVVISACGVVNVSGSAIDAARAPLVGATAVRRTTSSCVAIGARHQGGDRVTRRYAISNLKGVSCNFAKVLVARLTYEHLPSSLTGPNELGGWYCG